eukprot:CAMPEP_0171062736 /NCGR_PEP_ID=MMETSP0766_2-20121228/5215_1 /TAXON_ID=439317 /ORGANISM="Gambierdiscus australes, Strain CAWD 149" /LENGTH=102 /DNA_ID=CAMNT_0011518545 /DNA_START=267 /DNA_END=572 /DNA_ORIENTATION=-
MAWAFSVLLVRPESERTLFDEALWSLAGSGREDIHSVDWAFWKASHAPFRVSAAGSPRFGALCPCMCSAIWMELLWSRDAAGEAQLLKQLARTTWAEWFGSL